MTKSSSHARILIYSHDTFGLGHLRRCRAIAHALVEEYAGLSVLILSGSPIVGSFDFKARVDYVRIPGVIKLRNGEYTSLGLHIDLEQTLGMRSSIIQHTANIFEPQVFIVDKEPLGLRGEVEQTLILLKRKGTVNVLGLRDVMDDPEVLKAEWERKNVVPALNSLYDDIWVYGLREMGNPLSGLGISNKVLQKACFTGYLPREVPSQPVSVASEVVERPFILVTPGGGGDGAVMLDWVLRAYESCRDLPYGALVVSGPFLPAEQQRGFKERVSGLDNVDLITFDSHLEVLMEKSIAVVAMGGYNTFCEILSLDKRTLLVPRSIPRKEQLIRADCAQDLGLVRMLDADGARSTDEMIQALRELPHQPLPSEARIPHLLDGLKNVTGLLRPHIESGDHRRRLSV